MPRYWFTTHWPELQGKYWRDTRHIYLTEEHRDAVPNMLPGDRVLIYEFKSGPSLRKDGKIYGRVVGKGAIVSNAKIVESLHPRPAHEAREKYTNGKESNWAWTARTDDRKPCFVPRAAVNRIFNHRPGNNFRGYNSGRGIKEITADQYGQLLAASRQ